MNDTTPQPPQPPQTPGERQYVIDSLTFGYVQEWRQFFRSWLDNPRTPVVVPNIETWIDQWPQYADELRAFDDKFHNGDYHGFARWDTPADARKPLSATGERVMARIRAQHEGSAE